MTIDWELSTAHAAICVSRERDPTNRHSRSALHTPSFFLLSGGAMQRHTAHTFA